LMACGDYSRKPRFGGRSLRTLAPAMAAAQRSPVAGVAASAWSHTTVSA